MSNREENAASRSGERNDLACYGYKWTIKRDLSKMGTTL